MSSRLSAATALWFLQRFHLHLHALAQIVGRIHDYFAVFSQPIEHLELRTEIAPDPNGLPVNAIVFRYRSHLRSRRAEKKRICRDNDRRILVCQKKFHLALHSRVKFVLVVRHLHLYLHGA